MCPVNMLLDYLMVSDAVMCLIIMKPFCCILRVLIIGLCEYELMGLNISSVFGTAVINFLLTKSQIFSHIGGISMKFIIVNGYIFLFE
jgi:hypothetical protein